MIFSPNSEEAIQSSVILAMGDFHYQSFKTEGYAIPKEHFYISDTLYNTAQLPKARKNARG
jgi:hypothetical protein